MADIQEALNKVVFQAYRLPFATQSNFARKYASRVAMAASMGLITTRLFDQEYSNEWRVTMNGLGYLVIHKGVEYLNLGDPDDAAS